MGSIPVRVIKSLEHSLGGFFFMTHTGIEQGGGAKHRNQSPSGALVSPGVPPCRNVYCGCCIMQPVRGIEGTRPPAGGKKEPGGLFFSVRVPTARNVYRGCCRHDPYGNRTARPPIGGKQQSSGLLFSAGVPPCRNVYRGSCRFPLRPLPVKMRLSRPAGRDKRK